MPYPPTLTGRLPLKRPYGHLGWAACGHLLPPWAPHAVRVWMSVNDFASHSTLYYIQIRNNKTCFRLNLFLLMLLIDRRSDRLKIE